jgi:hypothetical protein
MIDRRRRLSAPRVRRSVPAPAVSSAPPPPATYPAARPGAIWIVVPCMGRLSFLQKTAGLVLAQPDVRYCLVDYSCPDRCGEWLERTFEREIGERRAVVERVGGQRLFNKSKAHNAGAWRALREGAEYLCFLDADTLVNQGFLTCVRERVTPRRFLIAGRAADGSDARSLTGLLAVHGQAFRGVGGFDESFLGWGAEDIELRLRLFLIGGLDHGDVPLSLIRPIVHDDGLRTQFYEKRNVLASNHDNMKRIQHKLATEWRDRCVRSVASAGRLWYNSGSSAAWAREVDARRPAPPDYPSGPAQRTGAQGDAPQTMALHLNRTLASPRRVLRVSSRFGRRG